MTLRHWQDQLHRHFDTLHQSRAAAADVTPVFALEHGLEEKEREALALEIKALIARAAPREFSLPWIVYAAEIGYRYSGDEYWQTFAQETPGWDVHGDREWLRYCFRAFQREFGGARPSGPWADHFSIICWPIAHAILPQDLQRQLAEILYYTRTLFSAELLAAPLALGEMIAAHSWNANSRFRNLTEEPLLLGQIAAALLLQGTQGSDSLILPATLNRIVADLNRTAMARTWLRDAQHVARQRVEAHGLSSGNGRHGESVHPYSADAARRQMAELAIEPRVILRPTSDSWNVLLELPDFSGLLAKFPALRAVLTGSRCVVAGSSGRPLARGALLHGPQQVILHTWPEASDVLLCFEQSTPPEFNYLLRTECLLRPGPRWLFRIASDGLAYELRGNVVRPGHRYILASSGGPWKASPGITPVSLECEGIHAALLNVPAAVSEEWSELLSDLGLNLARRIDVWPAGLAAASWDGQGRAEWLTSERPCLGIRVDHAVDAIAVTLRNTLVQRVQVNSLEPGSTVFVEIPSLPIGSHNVRFAVSDKNCVREEDAGELEVVIREPRTWTPGMSIRGALRVSVDPPAPSLEDMWEGRVMIDIRGPAGRQVIPSISLFERHADEASVRKRLPPLSIPVDSELWRSHFEKHFRNTKEVQRLYDAAHVCRVDLKAEELGGCSLSCEREFSPLRWVVRHRGAEYDLSLVDNSGSPGSPHISRYEFATPDKQVQLDPGRVSGLYPVPPQGGLYRAHTDGFEISVILPVTAKSFSLQELVIQSRLRRRSRTVSEIEELLSLIRMWFGARVTGFFSAANRQSVLETLLREIFAIIGGEHWARAEQALHSQQGFAALRILKSAVSTKQGWSNLCATLQSESWIYKNLEMRDRVTRFATTVQPLIPPQPTDSMVATRKADGVIRLPRTSQPEHPDWICEFALRLASSPETLNRWAEHSLRRGLEVALELPTLVRAARFLVLAVNRHSQAFAFGDGRLYLAWGWQ